MVIDKTFEFKSVLNRWLNVLIIIDDTQAFFYNVKSSLRFITILSVTKKNYAVLPSHLKDVRTMSYNLSSYVLDIGFYFPTITPSA
jgi:hypothetical protein